WLARGCCAIRPSIEWECCASAAWTPAADRLVSRRAETQHEQYGLGGRGDAAEIKPNEPVWVIPAKGAAGCRTAQHAMLASPASPSSALVSLAWASPGGWPRATYRSRCSTRGCPVLAQAMRRRGCS